jgi:hypothetical protein
MKKSVQIGANKTGLAMAPIMSKELFDGEDDKFKPFAQAEEDPRKDQTYADIRQEYIRSSSGVGSVPAPLTVKGVATTTYQKLTGRHPEVLIDKLGERMAFERTGFRLYEAFIQKCQTVLPEESIDFLKKIQLDEFVHFQLVKEAITSLGGDPTAVTPCADVAGVASKGLIAVINDPRTSIAQCANALLIAELTDNEGWELLIELTRQAKLDQLYQQFSAAKASEERHLSEIRKWLKELVFENDVIEYH